MSERDPVADLATLDSLDERDVISGYWAGRDGDGNEPSLEMNRSYWHGWKCGMADSNRYVPDETHRELIRLYIERGKLG